MNYGDQLREFFQKPINLGAERTLVQLSTEIGCDDNHKLGIALWRMANKSHELKCEKNAGGKNVYRWNDKRERAAAGGGRAARKKASARPGKSPRKVKAVKPRKTAPKAARAKHGGGQRTLQTAPAAALWALRQDGAFVLLGTQTEIQRADARALIEFVRQLDAGTA